MTFSVFKTELNHKSYTLVSKSKVKLYFDSFFQNQFFLIFFSPYILSTRERFLKIYRLEKWQSIECSSSLKFEVIYFKVFASLFLFLSLWRQVNYFFLPSIYCRKKNGSKNELMNIDKIEINEYIISALMQGYILDEFQSVTSFEDIPQRMFDSTRGLLYPEHSSTDI